MKAKNLARRARTDEQKLLRRQSILEAADAHFVDVGFEAFSMTAVAKRTGIVKGTLYLYFETREELLLNLCLEKLEAGVERLDSAMNDVSDDMAFAHAFYDSVYADPSFLGLLSRLDSVIEHNISLEILIDSKRRMAILMEQMAASVAPGLMLTLEQARDAVSSLSSLLLGAAQVDLGPKIDTATMPEDVRLFIDSYSSRERFTVNACRILQGIRSA